MNDIQEIRRINLARLIAEPPYNGDKKAFIAAAGITKGRLSQLLNGKEAFGDNAAKNLCVKLGLPDNYFSFVSVPVVAKVPLEPEAKKEKQLTEEAKRLGRLLDLIPEDDLIRRSQAYTTASTAILKVALNHNQQPSD